MGLREYKFKPAYNKSDDDIAEEFYLPAMCSSVKYDRISGYFGSTIYIIAWSALKQFVENGGKMRIICSPVLSDKDKAAMSEGYSARNDEIVQRSLAQELDGLFDSSETDKPYRVLACLVAEGILDVKIAVPQTGMEPDLQRLFHDKVGIFSDSDNNSVGFRGSMNETYQGLSDDGNSESIDVFPSWEDSRDSLRAYSAAIYFDKLWCGEESDVLVYQFPDALKKKLIEKSNGYDWKQLAQEISTSINLSRKWRSDKKNSGKTPRPHQVQALENWEKNGRRGILEHATGSGKTYTAICAIRDALNRHQSVLVLVPSKELLYQWRDEIKGNIKDIDIYFLLCGDGNNRWKSNRTLSLWTQPNIDMNRITIAIMDTACTDSFIKDVVQGPHLLLVADEVHRIGSPEHRKLFQLNAGERLGLSATPRRYGDPEGTSEILEYFGGIIQPVFTLQDAIKSGVLTKYFYFPQVVHLDVEEQDEWNKLTKKINRLIAISLSGNSSDGSMPDDPHLQNLMIQRSRIVKQAHAKVSLALSVLKKNYQDGQKWIVYCDDQNQLTEVLNLLLENHYDAHEYHSNMLGDRTSTLEYFNKVGGIIVSIRCLDEGVDIPSVTDALILASSKNPREFIQRRGRILRKAPGKGIARLYDAIAVPEESFDQNDKSTSIIEGELSRAIEFGCGAENPSCVYDLKMIARRYGIDFVKVSEGGYEDDGDETES